MGRFFHSVAWPAVAGNVVWAFFTVLIDANDARGGDSHWAKLVALLVLGFYLCIDWIDRDELTAHGQLRPTYWLPDLFFAPSIALYAIATQSNSSWANVGLALLFISALAGHVSGVWKPQDPSEPYHRKSYIAMNVLVLIVLWVGVRYLSTPLVTWAPTFALTIATALYVWILFRQKAARTVQ